MLRRSDRVGDVPPWFRVLGSLLVGVLAALLPVRESSVAALLGGWAAAGFVYCVWTLLVVLPMDAEETALHATREEPTGVVAHLVVVGAALVSVVGVVTVLVGGRHPLTVGSALSAVVVSWLTVHTQGTLRYARLYCTDPVGGIDFHTDDPPRYTDFAYIAFTVGMSFAISDTDLASSRMRAAALPHALVSYLFGTVIVALLVNLVAGLGG